ncbi:hypothetical protein GH714_029365 [Hevea brasiliensis]|uniref:Uncharacterized protein n=1 Tax=Hevea brasiliensis TaxID=3981 RepID=A0A6A6KP35_HEVBR|nr:hypothetical protein GH714_029365 [Hevea brasiliensis]
MENGNEAEEVMVVQEGNHQELGNGRNLLVKQDLLDLEGVSHNTAKTMKWGTIFKLPFQCIGVVYGDLDLCLLCEGRFGSAMVCYWSLGVKHAFFAAGEVSSQSHERYCRDCWFHSAMRD